MTVDTDPQRLLGSFRAKFFLATGSIGWGVKDAGITGLLLLFYSQVVGLPAEFVSFALGTALVFDAVIDPVIGIVSDNWKSSWGRRLPFMYASAVPVGLLYFILWQPPKLPQLGLFLYLLVITILVRAFIAMFEIPSASLVPELTNDYTKRTEFLNWRWFLGVLGAASIGFYSFFFLFVPDKSHPVGQLNPAGYPRYALVASTVMILSILISCLGLHRYIPHLIKTEPRYRTFGQFVRELAGTLKLKPFRDLVVSGLFASTVIGLNGAMSAVLLTYLWKLNNKQVALFSLVGIIGAVAAFTIFVPLAKSFEKKISAIATSVIATAAGTGPYIFAMFGWTPDIAGHPGLLLALLGAFVVFSGLAVTSMVLSGSMMADVVEYGAVRTGRRTEGAFFAATSLINKTVSGVGVFLSGIMIKLAHLPPHASPATLDPAILHHLLVLYVPTGIVLHAGAIIAFSRYPITRRDHEENVRRLSEETLALTQPPATVDATILDGQPLTEASGQSQIPRAASPSD